MNKKTQNMLLIGAGLAAAYYFYRQSNPAGSAETHQEQVQSAAATLQAQLNQAAGIPS